MRHGFNICYCYCQVSFQNEFGKLVFWGRFDILLEKRLSGVAELRYKMLYGKCEINSITELVE